jgi:hypothetical protein
MRLPGLATPAPATRCGRDPIRSAGSRTRWTPRRAHAAADGASAPAHRGIHIPEGRGARPPRTRDALCSDSGAGAPSSGAVRHGRLPARPERLLDRASRAASRGGQLVRQRRPRSGRSRRQLYAGNLHGAGGINAGHAP